MSVAAHSPAPTREELAETVLEEITAVTDLPEPGATAVVPYRIGPLSIRPDQTEPTPLQRAALAELGYTLDNGFTDAAIMLLLQTAVVTGADPFAQEIRLIQTWNVRDDGTRLREYAVIMAFHTMTGRAMRTGEFRGMEGPQFLQDDATDTWTDRWTGAGRPQVARCRVFREDVPPEHTPWAIIDWDEVCPKVVPMVDGPDGKRRRAPELGLVDHPRWQERGIGLFGKCAKAAAYRDRFPDVLGSVYLPEELERAQEAASAAEDEVRRAQGRLDARQHADDIRRLRAVGSAGGDVLVGTVERDGPAPIPAIATEAMRQAATARAAAEARLAGRSGADWQDAAPDEKGAWLWEELETWAKLLGVPPEQWTKPLEPIVGPLPGWGWQELLDVVGPLRRTVVDALRDAGRQAEATALNQVGPDVVAPVTWLLGQED